MFPNPNRLVRPGQYGRARFVVETKAGKTHAGILARESTDALYLLTTERVEIRVGREEIEVITAYLPKQLSDDDMKAAIAAAIKETGAASMRAAVAEWLSSAPAAAPPTAARTRRCTTCFYT